MELTLRPFGGDRRDSYIVRVNDRIVGFVDMEEDGRWSASIEGRRGVRYWDDLESAAREIEADAWRLFGARFGGALVDAA